MFTRVMAPVSVMLHDLGIRILGYLDDWQVFASSRKEAMWAWDVVLRRCHQHGIVVNLAKSYFSPSRTATYLWMTIKSPYDGFPLSREISTHLSQLGEFLSCKRQNVVAWRSLLSRLSSLCLFLPGGCLRIQSFQLELLVISWIPLNKSDLLWWSDISHHLQVVSLEVLHPACSSGPAPRITGEAPIITTFSFWVTGESRNASSG